MALDDDVIKILIQAKTDEAAKAEQALDGLGQRVIALKGQLDSGAIGVAVFERSFQRLDGQISKSRDHIKGLERDIVGLGGKIQGASRHSAKFQIGLAGANAAQDIIQGGPAAGINNALGLAGNNSARALGREWLAAAGGIGAVSTALAGVAVAAGAAFLIIDAGLKSAKLDWGDLDDVVANSYAWKALEETASGAMEALKDPMVAAAVDSLKENVIMVAAAAFPLIAMVGEYALGWNQATEAVVRQKAELANLVTAASQYAEALKSVGQIKSTTQAEDAKRGKLVGEQLAELGGGGGIDSVINRLADREVGKHGDDKVKVPELHASGEHKGEPTGNMVEITRREAARRRLTIDAAKAAGGDRQALDRLRPGLKSAGYDTTNVDAAEGGVDIKKEMKDIAAKEKAAAKKAESDAKTEATRVAREDDRRAKDLAKPLQDRFNVASADGRDVNRSHVKGELQAGGSTEEEADAAADAVLDKLQEGFAKAVRDKAGEKGIGEAQAVGELARDTLDKQRKEAIQEGEKARADKARAKVEAVAHADKATRGTGLDSRTEDAFLRNSLTAGGNAKLATDLTAMQLKREFMARGMNEDQAGQAARAKAEEQAAKTGDELARQRLEGPKPAEPPNAVQHMSPADFARSIESGAGADTKKLIGLTEQMKAQLAAIATNTRGGARLGP